MTEKNDRPHAPGVVRKVKRKKRPPKHNCDKNCGVCRMPCDNPINPLSIKKL
jgi:hypothetical protein